MKYNLWGSEVDLEIPNQQFPDHDTLEGLCKTCFNPKHGFFPTPDGQLHYIKYIPDNKPRAICVWQHGIHAHAMMSYKNPYNDEYAKMGLLAQSMVQAGYALYAPDLLGHGFSEGKRFYIPNGDWTINRDNLDSFARFVASEHKDIPFFIMGESYGGCLALHVAKAWEDDTKGAPSNFRGIALLAPAIIGDLPPKSVIFVLKNILKPMFPTRTPFFMPHPISAERIWRDEKIRNAFDLSSCDLGLHASGRPFCLGTAVGLLTALKSVRTTIIPDLSVPFCVLHGTEDYGVLMEGTDYLLLNAKTAEHDQAVRKIEGAYHDLLSEPTKKDTVQFIVDWIRARITDREDNENVEVCSDKEEEPIEVSIGNVEANTSDKTIILPIEMI